MGPLSTPVRVACSHAARSSLAPTKHHRRLIFQSHGSRSPELFWKTPRLWAAVGLPPLKRINTAKELPSLCVLQDGNRSGPAGVTRSVHPVAAYVRYVCVRGVANTFGATSETSSEALRSHQGSEETTNRIKTKDDLLETLDSVRKNANRGTLYLLEAVSYTQDTLVLRANVCTSLVTGS